MDIAEVSGNDSPIELLTGKQTIYPFLGRGVDPDQDWFRT